MKYLGKWPRQMTKTKDLVFLYGQTRRTFSSMSKYIIFIHLGQGFLILYDQLPQSGSERIRLVTPTTYFCLWNLDLHEKITSHKKDTTATCWSKPVLIWFSFGGNIV